MEKKINKFIIPALVILLCMNFVMFIRIRDMDNRIDRLSSNLDNAHSSLHNSISNISYNISEEMKKDSSMINSFTYEYGSFNNGNVDIMISVSPKSISTGDKLYFSYKTDNSPSRLIEAISNDGTNYNSAIVVAFRNKIELDFVIDDGTTKNVQKLDDIPSIEEILLSAFMIGERGGLSYSYPSKQLSFKNAVYSFDHHLNGKDEVSSLTEVKLIFEHNGNILKTYPMEIDSIRSHDFFDSYSVTIEDFTLNLDINDTFETYITAKDKRGFNIKAYAEKITVDENGRLIHDSPSRNNDIIIY